MAKPVVHHDEVWAVKLEKGTSRVRARIVALDDLTSAVVFSDIRTIRGPVGENPDQPSPAVAQALGQSLSRVEALTSGKRLRWFEHVVERPVQGNVAAALVEVIPRDEKSSRKPAIETPSVGGAFQDAAAWLSAKRKPMKIEAGEKLLGYPLCGNPFRIDDKVIPSAFGVSVGLPEKGEGKILRVILPSEVVVWLAGKERGCPESWFRLSFLEHKKTSGASKPEKPALVQKFQVGDVVVFDAYNAGVGAHPKGRVIEVVTPEEDPLSILADLLPDWKRTHTLLSPHARLSATATNFRYWVEADPTEIPKRGKKPRTRLFLKGQDWIGHADPK